MDEKSTNPRILVASQNPVKAGAIESAYLAMFGTSPIMSTISVSSGVPDQPMSDHETLQGAMNRARRAREAESNHDFYVGVEGGIEEHATGMIAFAWIVIFGQQLSGKSRTATFPLPPAIADLVRAGTELGKADDIVFGVDNSKQDVGAVGLLTGHVVSRQQLYEHAAKFAFIPFRDQNRPLFS
ncbi:MAG: inosine/xanthosine triphosphatase [Planctomycetales bacterium]|nr:inosine/xanthosine triphosphatase [Planctomycetales bacterium]